MQCTSDERALKMCNAGRRFDVGRTRTFRIASARWWAILLLSFLMGTLPNRGEAFGAIDPNTCDVPNIYLHAGLNFGLDWLNSSSISQEIEPYDLSELGVQVPFVVRAGWSNILQFEYQQSLWGTGHDMSYEHSYYSMSHGITTTEYKIEMDYDYSEFIFKINTLFHLYNKSNKALFLMIGQGNVEYLDGVGDGWTGDSLVYGIEYSQIEKYGTLCAGLKLANFDLSPNTSVLASRNYSGHNYMLYVGFAFGYGW